MKSTCLLSGIVFFLSLNFSRAEDKITQTLSLKNEFQKGQTVVWSPAFQRCWDETLKFYNIQSLDLKPGGPVVDELNAFTFDYEATVPFDSHLAIVTGRGEKFRKEVNKLIIRHFGRTVPSFEKAAFAGENADSMELGVMLLSILKHKLAFEAQFEKSPQPLKFTTDAEDSLNVNCFGIWGEHRKKDSGGRVIAYHPEDDRLGIIFPGKNAEEEVILIQDPAIKTPLEAIEAMRKWSSDISQNDDPRKKTGPLDTIVIPQLQLKSQADFVSQLPGKMHLAGGLSYIQIVGAHQTIDLKLDEKGAEMVTKAFILPATFLVSGGALWDEVARKKSQPEERFFVFDQPFIFMIRKAGAEHPFFFARIGGPGLVPFKKP